METSDKEKLML